MAIDLHSLQRQNAFSDRLSQFGLDFFVLCVVDLLHEIELGVWKSLLIHLLRILESADENTLHELDRRYVIHNPYSFPQIAHCPHSFRMLPTFGRDTIRRFTSNTSELKRMAARDYEDILQVSTYHFRTSVENNGTFLGSALSRYLKDYYRNPTTRSFFGYFSPSLTGMG
jgi:hypothetical protein